MESVKWILRVFGFVMAPGLFFPMNAQQLNIEWGKNFGGTYTEVGKAVTADVSGNSYCVGYFNGMMDADPGPAYLPLVSAGMQDVFLVKTSAAGQTLWAKRMGGSQSDLANSITIDQQGNVYITGSFMGMADFDPGNATFNLTSFTSFSQDIFVAKYDQSGVFQWAISFGGDGYYDSLGNTYDAVSSGYGIQFDKHGSLLLTGRIHGCIDFHPGIGVDTLSARMAPACCIVKLGLDGNLRWAKQLGGGLHGTEGYGIQSDAGGNVYTCGVFSDSADFDPGLNTHWMHCIAYNHAFVSKLDSNGNFVWARQLGGSSSYDQATAQSLDIDGFGNVVIGGHFKGNGDFDPGTNAAYLQSNGQYDCFLLKLNGGGQFIWAKRIGELYNDYCYSVSIGLTGFIYTTGNFRGSVDFDPGVMSKQLTSASLFAADLYMTCFNSSGDLIDATRIGGNGTDGGNAVSANNNGLVYLCGFLSGPTTIQTIYQTQSLTSFGGIDIFLMKLKEPVLPVLTSIQEARMVREPVYEIRESVDVDALPCTLKAGREQDEETRQRPLVYPIPSKGIVTIEYPYSVHHANLKVMNASGEMVYEAGHSYGRVYRLDLGKERKGNYLLEIRYTPSGEKQEKTDLVKLIIID